MSTVALYAFLSLFFPSHRSVLHSVNPASIDGFSQGSVIK